MDNAEHPAQLSLNPDRQPVMAGIVQRATDLLKEHAGVQRAAIFRMLAEELLEGKTVNIRTMPDEMQESADIFVDRYGKHLGQVADDTVISDESAFDNNQPKLTPLVCTIRDSERDAMKAYLDALPVTKGEEGWSAAGEHIVLEHLLAHASLNFITMPYEILRATEAFIPTPAAIEGEDPIEKKNRNMGLNSLRRGYIQKAVRTFERKGWVTVTPQRSGMLKGKTPLPPSAFEPDEDEEY